jgi:hypothetical protein
VYDPSLGFAQIDDMNPGITPFPSGLFWTTRLPEKSVHANPGAGQAVIEAHNIAVQDFGDFNHAVSGNPGQPATVSFKVQWSGVDERVNVKNRSDGFAGEFVRNSAQMEWSATVGDYSFVSAPLETSSSAFAEVGTERNGSFFPHS